MFECLKIIALEFFGRMNDGHDYNGMYDGRARGLGSPPCW